MKSFSGFHAETLDFLTELGANNRKEWFDQNRDRYEKYFLVPAKDFITALGPGLRKIAPAVQAVPKVNGSIFRINRDVRFSKDKTPYKDHLDMWFWEGERRGAVSGFFLRLTDRQLIIGAGAHQFQPDSLQAYRAALTIPVQNSKLRTIISATEAADLTVGGTRYARLPRGCVAGDEFDERFLRHNALTCDIHRDHPPSLHSADFVDHCLEIWKKTAPLHRWLMDNLG